MRKKKLDKDWEKHFKHIFSLAKKPVTVNFQDKDYVYGDFDEKYLSPTIFRNSLTCSGCGECCQNYTLIWDKIHKVPDTQKMTIEVNGKEFSIYYLPKTKDKKWHCQWVELERGEYRNGLEKIQNSLKAIMGEVGNAVKNNSYLMSKALYFVQRNFEFLVKLSQLHETYNEKAQKGSGDAGNLLVNRKV